MRINIRKNRARRHKIVPRETPRFAGKRQDRILLLLVLGFLSFGCSSSIDKAVEETTEQTHAIGPAGTLTIRNPMGSVRIQGSDDLEMKLKATKKASSARQLNGIAVKVAKHGDSISVDTSFPPHKKWVFSRGASIDYAISIPRTIKISRLEMGNGNTLVEGMRGDLRADLVNGALAMRNCFGNAEISVANGSLDLFFEKWEQRPFSVHARIISGNARAFFPRDASFHVEGKTVSGTVTNRLAKSGDRDSREAKKLNMSMGTGTAPDIMIHAIDGDIEIAPANGE